MSEEQREATHVKTDNILKIMSFYIYRRTVSILWRCWGTS